MAAGELGCIFIDFSVDKLKQLTSRIEDCLNRLDAAQIWTRNSENENAIGNLVLHLCGNVTQWIVSGVGGRPDNRDRSSEFAAREGLDAAVLCERLHNAIDDAIAVIREQNDETLAEIICNQGYTRTKLESIYHVVEHFAMHTGQIIFATKLLTGQDLGYYEHLSTAAGRTTEQASLP